MKIAIFSDTYEPEINGVVTSTFTMKVKLEGMGHKVIIVCPKTKKAQNRLMMFGDYGRLHFHSKKSFVWHCQCHEN